MVVSQQSFEDGCRYAAEDYEAPVGTGSLVPDSACLAAGQAQVAAYLRTCRRRFNVWRMQLSKSLMSPWYFLLARYRESENLSRARILQVKSVDNLERRPASISRKDFLLYEAYKDGAKEGGVHNWDLFAPNWPRAECNHVYQLLTYQLRS